MDISMCLNRECPSRLRCHRYTADSDWLYQSVMNYKPDKDTGKCKSFWDNEGYRKAKRFEDAKEL